MTGSYVNGGGYLDCATEFDNHDKQENENATQANEKVISTDTVQWFSNELQPSIILRLIFKLQLWLQFENYFKSVL